MRIDLARARTIAIVGNGSIRADVATQIDTCDLVIRMNHAPLCGVAGRRTDILVLNRHSIRRQFEKRPTNRLAMRGAEEIWLGFDGFASPLEDSRLNTMANGRPFRMLPKTDALKQQIAVHWGDWTMVVPSLGALTLDTVVRESTADIRLFGFDHAGWGGHSWSLEKQWFDAVRPDRVRRITGTAAPLAPAHRHSIERGVGLIQNRFRRVIRKLRAN